MRAFAQWLFPETGADAGIDRSEGKDIWMVYGTRHESELYYREEFEALAARKPNFHYLPTLSRADESWKGLRGYVQDHVARIVEERAARLGQPLPAPPPDPSIPPNELNFDIYAYICGLNNMVASVREKLLKLRLAPQANRLRALRLTKNFQPQIRCHPVWSGFLQRNEGFAVFDSHDAHGYGRRPLNSNH